MCLQDTKNALLIFYTILMESLNYTAALKALVNGKSIKVTFIDLHGQVTTKVLTDNSVSKLVLLQAMEKKDTKVEIMS